MNNKKILEILKTHCFFCKDKLSVDFNHRNIKYCSKCLIENTESSKHFVSIGLSIMIQIANNLDLSLNWNLESFSLTNTYYSSSSKEIISGDYLKKGIPIEWQLSSSEEFIEMAKLYLTFD